MQSSVDLLGLSPAPREEPLVSTIDFASPASDRPHSDYVWPAHEWDGRGSGKSRPPTLSVFSCIVCPGGAVSSAASWFFRIDSVSPRSDIKGRRLLSSRPPFSFPPPMGEEKASLQGLAPCIARPLTNLVPATTEPARNQLLVQGLLLTHHITCFATDSRRRQQQQQQQAALPLSIPRISTTRDTPRATILW